VIYTDSKLTEFVKLHFGYLQTRGLEQKFEHERDELRARAADSEKKLQERTQELSLAEQALAARSSEFEALQANMKELEELREMKEVGTWTRKTREGGITLLLPK
jgi:chromosome segregation ATPase